MTNPSRFRLREERGQALVIMTVSLAALLAMTALIIDGGNAMAQHRGTQNASDAAALAGATVMVENMGGQPRSDGDVLVAVQAAFWANDTDFGSAQYVDYDRNVIGTVGQGGAIPSSAGGVQAQGERTFDTYVAGIVGMQSADVAADATALAGALTGVCPASEGCGVAPVTFSIPVRVCDGTNRPMEVGLHWPLASYEDAMSGNTATMSTVPLCTTGPGGVGWLDMKAVGCDQGTLADWIREPCNESFDIPTWFNVKPGVNDNVEGPLNAAYKGKVMLLPLFDATCKEPPSSGQPQDCTDPGKGANLWYHVPKFAAFVLHHAYIQGDNRAACQSPPGLPLGGGNGSTACLKGWFVRWITMGPVGRPEPCVGARCADSVFGVQLVR